MAEAILRHRAGDRFESCSAGMEPTGVHPFVRQVLREAGIESDQLRSKGLLTFLGRDRIDYAIIVCERAQQDCPRLYPFTINNLYWPFDDPAAFAGPNDEKLERFRVVRDQIDRRIQDWLRDELQAATSAQTSAASDRRR